MQFVGLLSDDIRLEFLWVQIRVCLMLHVEIYVPLQACFKTHKNWLLSDGCCTWNIEQCWNKVAHGSTFSLSLPPCPKDVLPHWLPTCKYGQLRLLECVTMVLRLCCPSVIKVLSEPHQQWGQKCREKNLWDYCLHGNFMVIWPSELLDVLFSEMYLAWGWR